MRNFQDASEISKRSFKEILNIKKKKNNSKNKNNLPIGNLSVLVQEPVSLKRYSNNKIVIPE